MTTLGALQEGSARLVGGKANRDMSRTEAAQQQVARDVLTSEPSALW